MTAICIIPARGGSKRIPNKNIREFHGRPMLHRAIEIAVGAQVFDTILVSTDSPEVAAVAMSYPSIPASLRLLVVERPAHLADDMATTAQVMAHELHGWPVDTVACCLYPCSPMADPNQIGKAVRSMHQVDQRFAMPITQVRPPMQRALRRDSAGTLEPVWVQFENVRTQDLEPRYRDAGQWYVATARSWLDPRLSIYRNAIGWEVPAWRGIDIDDEEDWFMARAVYATLRMEGEVE